MAGPVQPDIEDPATEWLVNLCLHMRKFPSQVETEATERDLALLRQWWERFGSYEPLISQAEAQRRHEAAESMSSR